MPVHDISETLALSQPLTSWHLLILKRANLVKTRKSGRQVLYRLDREYLLAYQAQFAELMACHNPLRSGLPFKRGMPAVRACPSTAGLETRANVAAATPTTTEACTTDHQRISTSEPAFAKALWRGKGGLYA